MIAFNRLFFEQLVGIEQNDTLEQLYQMQIIDLEEMNLLQVPVSQPAVPTSSASPNQPQPAVPASSPNQQCQPTSPNQRSACN